MDIEQIERELVELLESDISTNKLSRKADIAISTISKIRSGKSKLDNTAFVNIKRLHNAYKDINNESLN